MILPSDETPGTPGDPDPEPEDDFAWAAGASPEEVPPAFSDPYGPDGGVEHPAPPGWREDLKRSVMEAIKDLSVIEDPAEDFDPPEPPDLFMFFGELAALRSEVRRGHKKLADGVQRLTATSGGASGPADVAPAHELVALYDLIVTGGRAAEAAPLIESALVRAGIMAIPLQPGQPFDAATMSTADGKTPAKSAQVKSVQRPGFTWQGRLLRPALVEV